MVESRRGSGGFVRIMRMEPQTKQLQHEPTAAELVEHMADKKLITAREGVLLQYMLKIIDADESKKKKVLQQAIGLLSSSGRR